MDNAASTFDNSTMSHGEKPQNLSSTSQDEISPSQTDVHEFSAAPSDVNEDVMDFPPDDPGNPLNWSKHASGL